MNLSIVIPFFNEAVSVARLFESLEKTMSEMDTSYQIVCVDDGSTDETLSLLLSEKAKRESVVVLRLSRNFGKEAALTAGLDYAKGKSVLFMDADLQHPPEVIPLLFEKLKGGVDVVYGVRDSRTTDGKMRAGFSRLFYKLFSASSRVTISPDAGDFRVFSKRAADALRCLPERRRFLKGLYAWIGFKQEAVSFSVKPRHAGKSSFSFFSLFAYAWDGLVSFTVAPLRIMVLTGFSISFLSALYAVTIIIETLLTGKVVPGYPTLGTAIFFFGGVQLLCIGILGEYVGRIFDETKGRPTYILESIDE